MKYITLSALLIIGLASPAFATEEVPDGSFENFDYTWECDLNCLLPVNDYFVFSSSAYDGIAYAYLLHDAGIYQDLTVPTDASSVSFWYDNQPDDVVPEDGAFMVYLLDPNTNEVYTEQLYTEQSDSWIEGSLSIPAELQGTTVRLYLANTAGFNRIDYLQFQTEADELAELQQLYAAAKVRVFSTKGKAVEDAKVFVKKNGVKLSLLDLTTNETVTTINTNKKGRAHHFYILETWSEDDTIKLCVKKNRVTECSVVSPATGMETAYEFTAESKKIK